MKLTLPFLFSWVLFAEGDVLGPWANLTALGIVAVVLVFMVTKILPSVHIQFAQQSQAFAEAMVKSQAGFTETLDKIASRTHEDSLMLASAINNLREHCAAVAGHRTKVG